MCYVVGGCNVVATQHGRYSLCCMQKLSAGSVWYVYVESCGVSSTEYHALGVNRPSACREFFGVHS